MLRSGLIKRSKMTASVISGALWSSANMLLIRLATIAVTVFVVRVVSPRDFGIFAAALVVYTVVSAFSDLGVSVCIARRDLEPHDMAPVVMTISIVSSVMLAGSVFLLAHPIAVALGAVDAAGAIRVLSVAILLDAITAVPSALLTRNFRQGSIFVSSLVAFLPANTVLVLLALNGDGAMAFAWSRLVGQIISGAVIIALAGRWYWPGWNSSAARRALALGLPLAGANLLGYLLINADYVFIGSLLGPELLGTYTLGFNVASWSTSVLGASINGVAMPSFSDARSDPQVLRAAVERWVAITGVVALPVAALTAVLAPDLIHVLYGEKWADAGPVLSVLAIYGGIFIFTLLGSNLLVGVGRTGLVFVIQAAWLAGLLGAVVVGVSTMGIIGAAWAHLAVIVLVVTPALVAAIRPVVPQLARMIYSTLRMPLAAAAIAAMVTYFGGQLLSPGLGRLIGGGVSGALIFCLIALPSYLGYLPEGVVRHLSLLNRLVARTRRLSDTMAVGRD